MSSDGIRPRGSSPGMREWPPRLYESTPQIITPAQRRALKKRRQAKRAARKRARK